MSELRCREGVVHQQADLAYELWDEDNLKGCQYTT